MIRHHEPCIICGGSYAASRIPGLLECRSCSFVTADLTLGNEELEKLYTARYFAGEEYMDYVAERPLIENQFRIRLKDLLRFVPNPASKSLFEIGSAYGFFLSVARTYFASVEGIDISSDATAYARGVLGLQVHTGDFADHVFSVPPDVVCLWDTIEHIQHPHRYFEKLGAIMPSGGVVALTTGDISSFMARFRGGRWRQIHPPTHLHYFSKKTLALMLNNYGFEVCSSGYPGMYRSVDTMAYILMNIKHDYSKAYSMLKRSGLLNWNLYLNLYDTVFIIARKK